VNTENTSETLPAKTNKSGSLKTLFVGLILVALAYFLIAYVIIPFGWKTYSKKHPSFDDDPRLTETGDGHPGGPVNVALVGGEDQVKQIMEAAKWYDANPLGVKSDLKIAADSVLSRSYDEAPVSKLYLFGRPEDFAFEQSVDDNPRHRHHIRFWRAKKDNSDGRPIWLGAASYDERVGLSHTTAQFTHHIAPDVDAERDHVFATLKTTNELAETYQEKGFQTALQGENGGGYPWHTDGNLWVGVIKENFARQNAEGNRP
jgi:hypothetical protein